MAADRVSGSLGSNMCIAISRGRKALCLRTSPQRTAFPQVESVSSLFLLCSVTSMVWHDLSPIWPAYSRLHNHNSSVVTAGLPLPVVTARHWYDELSTVPELLSLAVVITNAPVEFENQAAPQYGLSFDHRQNFQVLFVSSQLGVNRGIYLRYTTRQLEATQGSLLCFRNANRQDHPDPFRSFESPRLQNVCYPTLLPCVDESSDGLGLA